MARLGLAAAAFAAAAHAEGFCPASCLADDAYFCRNSVNGTGVHSTADPSPESNRCEHCLPGYGGTECRACTSHAGCPSAAGNDVCSASHSLQDEHPGYMLCELVDEDILGLLQGGNPGVRAVVDMTWTKPTGWLTGGAAGDKDGQLDFKFYRSKPMAGAGDPGYLSRYFECKAQQCYMSAKRYKIGEGIVHERYQQLAGSGRRAQVQEATAAATAAGANVSTGELDSEKNPSQRMGTFGHVTMGVLAVALCGLCAAGFVENGMTRRRMVTFGTLFLVLTLSVLVVSIMVPMEKAEEEAAADMGGGGADVSGTYVEVAYTCETVNCGCSAPGPNDWDPKCAGSSSVSFSKLLTNIDKPLHIICDNTTTSPRDINGAAPCVFRGDDLLDGYAVMLGCNVSQCVTDAKAAHNATHIDAEDLSQKNKSLGYFHAVMGILAAALLALAAHFLYSARVSQRNVEEWRALYHCTGSNPTSPWRVGDGSPGERRGRLDSQAGEELRSVAGTENLSLHFDASTAGGSDIAAAPAGLADQQVQLQTRLLSYHIGSGPSQKKILNKITLELPPGKSLAIMGPSGAGKTTFLDILAARDKRGVVTGSLLMNNVPISGCAKMMDMYRDVIGYVSQEDSLIASLTVMESVMYSARLRLPKGMPDEEKVARAEQVIADLGLAHCKNSRIGGRGNRGISGGEKRRVSIAMELVANPRILFLDEPTSGLDSYNALVVMETIARMKTTSAAAEYSTFFNYQTAIVFVIHQPSKEIFDTFDNLMLLSKGQLLYCGAADAALATFGRLGYRAPPGTTNPADYLLKVANTMSAEERSTVASTAAVKYTSLLGEVDAQDVKQIMDLNASETASVNSHEDMLSGGLANNSLTQSNVSQLLDTRGGSAAPHQPPAPLRLAAENRKYYVNFYEELRIVGRRGFKSLLGNYYLVMCHIVVTLALVGILFTFYSRQPLNLPGILNRAGCFSFTLILLAFSSMSSLELFLNERDVYTAERNNRYYGSLSYFLTKLVFDIVPLRVIPPLLLGAVTYNQMGLRTDEAQHFVCFLCVLVLFNIITAGISMKAAMVTSSFGAGVLLASLMILTFFAFDPLIVQGTGLPDWLAWVRFVSPFFLAVEVLMINELHGQRCNFAPTTASGKKSESIPIPCDTYLVNFGLDLTNFGFDLSVLMVWAAFAVFAAWFCLHFVVKEKR